MASCTYSGFYLGSNLRRLWLLIPNHSIYTSVFLVCLDGKNIREGKKNMERIIELKMLVYSDKK